jgi:RNA polymerase sigma factor (sigma-70 family)
VPNDRTDNRVLPLLQAMFAHDAEGVSDGQLLRRFLNERDEAAFAALVRRHGSMVLSVCRRVLGNVADAEDAFQGAFLVLVRKAPSLSSRRVVGDWLHGVARRTALKARAAAARRRVVESAMALPEAQGDEARNDFLPRLDEELSRLPEKYRLPIVLCDLEGKTRKQAARQLGWPEGTVAGRLACGRDLLAKRLLRGTLMGSGALASTLTGGTAKAALPLGLLHSTIKAATLFAAGEVTAQGVLSGTALALAKGVVQTMFWNKMKIAVVTLFLSVALVGVGGRTIQLLGGEKQGPQQLDSFVVQTDGKKAVPGDQTEQANADQSREELLKAWVKAGQEQWEGVRRNWQQGRIDVDPVLTASRDLLRAELKLAEKKRDGSMNAAYQAHVDRMLETEKIQQAKWEAGQILAAEVHKVVFARLEANVLQDDARRGIPSAETKAKKGNLPESAQTKKSATENQKQMVDRAGEQFEARWKEYLADKTTVDFVLTAASDLLKTELAAAEKQESKIAIYEAHIKKTEELWKIGKAKYEAGQVPVTEYAQIRGQLEDLKAQLIQARNAK